MDKNEMKRKNKRDFFARITRGKAKKAIIESEEKLGRKLTKEEKNEIIRWAARTAKIKTGAWALIAAMGIGGFSIGYKMLNPGEEPKPQEPSEIVETTPQESFKESLKVTEEQLENDNEEQLPYSKDAAEIINDIDNLKTKEDVLAWWKNLYIEEYEKITGDDTLTTGDIKILQSSQSFLFRLENGNRVTHGGNIEKTSKLIEADGYSGYETERDAKVFKVISNKSGEIIDCATTSGNKVIPGDRYEEMKEYESVLERLGIITKYAYEAMDNPAYEISIIKLKDATIAYYISQNDNGQIQPKDNGQIHPDNGR